MVTESRLSGVRAQILRQHVEIRARLRGIERLAKKNADARHLRMSLVHFASAFEAHLIFEERELLPIVREVDAWGPVRVAAMQSEHAEQRRRVERIVAFAEDQEVRRHELEGEVHWLAQSLVADMDNEESDLLLLEQIDSVSNAQMTG